MPKRTDMNNLTKIRRKDEIRHILQEDGNVEVRDLALRFEVSEATIRRDLRNLSTEGFLELVYGGATLPRYGNYTLQSRQSRNHPALSQRH